MVRLTEGITVRRSHNRYRRKRRSVSRTFPSPFFGGGGIDQGTQAAPGDDQRRLLAQGHLYDALIPAYDPAGGVSREEAGDGRGDRSPRMTLPCPMSVLKSPRPTDESNPFLPSADKRRRTGKKERRGQVLLSLAVRLGRIVEVAGVLDHHGIARLRIILTVPVLNEVFGDTHDGRW